MTKYGDTLPLFPDIPPEPEPTRLPKEDAPAKVQPPPRFDVPVAPSSGIDTSIEAAQEILPAVAGLRRRVLLAIVAAEPEGLIAEEVGVACGLKSNTVHPRLWELEGKYRLAHLPALITMSERRRKTTSGRSARVYRATPLGIQVVALMTREP